MTSLTVHSMNNHFSEICVSPIYIKMYSVDIVAICFLSCGLTLSEQPSFVSALLPGPKGARRIR